MKSLVVVAMSGGVDSSVAAALLQAQGNEIIGITMRIWPYEEDPAQPWPFDSCCSPSSVEDARQVASNLNISFYVHDYRQDFQREVIDYFCEEYLAGRTPNPCIPCNLRLKFGVLRQKARGWGAGFVATGHYVRRELEAGGRYNLHRGVDAAKDQSYFLYGMTQEQLSSALFPLGNLTKQETRQWAQKFGLKVAQKPESQEICFIPDNDYRGFLRKHRPQAFAPGSIINREGKVLGQHEGVANYTIGQRSGLGISVPRPLYVLELRPPSREVVVGFAEELGRKELTAIKVNFISGETLKNPLEVECQIRYRHKPQKALISPIDDDTLKVEFQRPQRDITPGQAVVFYRGDLMLGGGVISEGESVKGILN